MVTLRGSAPEYSGVNITFLTFSDQITYTEQELCSFMVDENGDFSCSFNTNETIYVFTHLGAYEAFLFVEPGKSYDVLLPEKKEKTLADGLNPYFKPIQYHLGLINISENELNYQLAFFDEIYSLMGSMELYSIYNKIKQIDDKSKFNDVDTVYSPEAYSKIVNNSTAYISNNLREIDVSAEILKVDSLFSDVDNKFFNDFKKYKFALYRSASSNQKMKSISNTYYLDNKILYQNNAYMDLFNQVYDEYFQYFGRTESGKKIYSDIGKLKSINALKNTLGNDSILANDTLKEFVILKCLHDEFYNDKFSRSALLTVLDSLALQTNVEEHKQIAGNIREKVTKLMLGYEPPKFELYDKDSNLISLDSYKGKYVYLGFCTTTSYACIKEFAMLDNMYKKHKDHFEIVIISMDESLPQMKRFVEMKNYSFKFLYYGNQSDVFKDYDIRAFPTYYFIDKNGKLAITPAPSPDQNSEFAIFKVMRANGDI
jgi:peroxiredoxin